MIVRPCMLAHISAGREYFLWGKMCGFKDKNSSGRAERWTSGIPCQQLLERLEWNAVIKVRRQAAYQEGH